GNACGTARSFAQDRFRRPPVQGRTRCPPTPCRDRRATRAARALRDRGLRGFPQTYLLPRSVRAAGSWFESARLAPPPPKSEHDGHVGYAVSVESVPPRCGPAYRTRSVTMTAPRSAEDLSTDLPTSARTRRRRRSRRADRTRGSGRPRARTLRACA